MGVWVCVGVGVCVGVTVGRLLMKMARMGSENGPAMRSTSPTIARARNVIRVSQGICPLSR
jgi:uncharacterized membrane-anchored protein YhcB (DUF1043 family)